MYKLPKTLFMILVSLSTILSACAAKAPWTRPSDKMGMTYIPAGKFTMGITAQDALAACQNDCPQGVISSDFHFWGFDPPRTVCLDAFWIDKTDVTNAMYAKCVSAGALQKPLDFGSAMRSIYYSNPKYDNYPVINLNWNMAQAYCKWAGARLPSEAE